MRKFYFLLLLILSSCAKKVDLIVHNAEVYVADLNFNKSSAFAINDGLFVEVGEEEILKKYSSNNIIDAQGLPVYPGFIDSHAHFYSLGYSKNQVDLFNTKSLKDVVERTLIL